MSESTIPNKPFHLLTPNEKTALRIAQNRAIAERIAERGATPTTKRGQKPPARSSADYTRATPEERAAGSLGGVIRKVQS